ncbi:hypothetical protein TNCV_1255631 [Trichonephila clavipes]|nr:hypothetical protein TNCV_1255631 [Trichonephila clavipes]
MGSVKWEIVSPDDPDQDNGTKLSNYCIAIGPGQVSKISIKPDLLNYSPPNSIHGRGSQVIMVMDSWLACHEIKLSTAEDPPRSGNNAL